MRLLLHVAVAWLAGNTVVLAGICLEARSRRRAAERGQRIAPVIPLHPRQEPHLRPVAHR